MGQTVENKLTESRDNSVEDETTVLTNSVVPSAPMHFPVIVRIVDVTLDVSLLHQRRPDSITITVSDHQFTDLMVNWHFYLGMFLDKLDCSTIRPY